MGPAKAKAPAKGKAKAKSVARPKGGTIKVMKGKGKAVATVREALYQKGRVDRDIVRKHTSMSKEAWAKHQDGMAEKWPMPAYMKGEKGHMAFKDETYAIVTCWMAETPIEYRPHAKAPGSKSHLRYERYSKAKTVGEALKFGSYPVDWCWDYERGFLRVKGGPLRDEPLDITKDDKASDVDRAIHTWYVKELAKMLSMKPSQLAASAGHGESVHIRAMRLLAQREATERLEAADREGRAITDEEVLETLKRWPFARNPYRKNVMQPGKTWVFSDSLGALRDRQGDIHLTAPTRRYPQVAELFGRWLKDRIPAETKDFTWTTINVNCNYAAALHRDNGNFGPSYIKAFGEFTGGELNYWPDDDGGDLQKLPKHDKVSLDLQKGLALFNGNCAHSVDKFEGSRYSLVFFTLGCHASIKSEDRERLKKLGFAVPAPTADPFKLLRAPKGYAKKHGLSKKDNLPSYRFHESKSMKLVKTKPKSKAEVKKLSASRLQPENQRTFYTAEARQAERARRQEEELEY